MFKLQNSSVAFKLCLFAILAVVAFVLGYSDAIWPHATVVEWIRYGGYWIILATVLVWGYSLTRAYPTLVKKEGYTWLTNRKNYLAIAMVVGFWVLIQFQEEKSFKILLDEPVLVNTSRMMHYERELLVVSNAQRVDGILAAKGYVDKRPNFFPFLVSVLHDVTGYRVENAFYLNAALTLALLALMYSVTAKIAGPMAGLVSLTLLASVPLLWHQSSGAGFEILNMVMILLTLKIAIDYLLNPSRRLMCALILTTVMLAQVRYESILFVIPVAIVIMMGWSLRRQVQLPWAAWLAPVALIPVLWQQRVFNLDEGFWELFTVGLQQPFSLDYYNENLMQALYFFFEWIKQLPNAPMVAILGWIGALVFIIGMILRLVKQEKRTAIIDEERPQLVLWVFFLGLGLYFTLLMCYAFDLGRYMVMRLSLPLYLGMALAAGVVWVGWLRSRRWHIALGAIMAVAFVGYSLPNASSRQYAAIYFPMVEAQHIDKFIKEHKERGQRYLIVADMSMLWTTYDLEALPNRAVNNQPELIKYFLENPNNPPIYVVQSLEYDPVQRRFVDIASEPLTEAAVLKPIWERYISSFRVLRISRLMELDGVEPIDDTELYQGGEARKLQDWVNQLP